MYRYRCFIVNNSILNFNGIDINISNRHQFLFDDKNKFLSLTWFLISLGKDEKMINSFVT